MMVPATHNGAAIAVAAHATRLAAPVNPTVMAVALPFATRQAVLSLVCAYATPTREGIHNSETCAAHAEDTSEFVAVIAFSTVGSQSASEAVSVDQSISARYSMSWEDSAAASAPAA
jgi:hypothetical protein